MSEDPICFDLRSTSTVTFKKPSDFFSMLLTLLGGVGNERAEVLLQLLAAARRAFHVAPFMLFQR
ncbi:MAG: hypothetical protein OEW25_12310, partial [Nitrospira sp.]|nr:hypothetical protein [Nitrospira sp.]